MTIEEAREWLKGERSMSNTFHYIESVDHVLCAQADAAMTQQAYWMVKAHDDGLEAGQ